jgi:hypothetical protein
LDGVALGVFPLTSTSYTRKGRWQRRDSGIGPSDPSGFAMLSPGGASRSVPALRELIREKPLATRGKIATRYTSAEKSVATLESKICSPRAICVKTLPKHRDVSVGPCAAMPFTSDSVQPAATRQTCVANRRPSHLGGIPRRHPVFLPDMPERQCCRLPQPQLATKGARPVSPGRSGVCTTVWACLIKGEPVPQEHALGRPPFARVMACAL